MRICAERDGDVPFRDVPVPRSEMPLLAPCPARHHDRRVASRLHLARQARAESEGRRQAVAALLPQLLGGDADLGLHSRAVRRAGRQLQQPRARRRRAGAHRRSQARQHARQSSRLRGQQPAAAARRRSRRRWRARSGWPPTPATATRSTTISASRPKPRSAPRKKTLRPTSARRRRRSPSAKPAPPVVVDRAAWEQRVKALSRVFREYPDVYQNLVMLTVQNETDYYRLLRGLARRRAAPAGAPGGLCRDPRRRRHGPVSRPDLRSRNRRRPALPVGAWKLPCANSARASKHCAKLRSPSPSMARPFSPAAPPPSSSMKCSATGSKASASAATKKARPLPRN